MFTTRFDDQGIIFVDTTSGNIRSHAMDWQTFTDTIRVFKHRSPFRPFTVTTVNGGKYEVDHPDALAVRPALRSGPSRR